MADASLPTRWISLRLLVISISYSSEGHLVENSCGVVYSRPLLDVVCVSRDLSGERYSRLAVLFVAALPSGLNRSYTKQRAFMLAIRYVACRRIVSFKLVAGEAYEMSRTAGSAPKAKRNSPCACYFLMRPAIITGLTSFSCAECLILLSGFCTMPKVSVTALRSVGRCMEQGRRLARPRSVCGSC